MEINAQYCIKQKKNASEQVVLIVNDENPAGTTLTIKDNAPGGQMVSFNMSRVEMVEALEYIVVKLKTNLSL